MTRGGGRLREGTGTTSFQDPRLPKSTGEEIIFLKGVGLYGRTGGFEYPDKKGNTSVPN